MATKAFLEYQNQVVLFFKNKYEVHPSINQYFLVKIALQMESPNQIPPSQVNSVAALVPRSDRSSQQV